MAAWAGRRLETQVTTDIEERGKWRGSFTIGMRSIAKSLPESFFFARASVPFHTKRQIFLASVGTGCRWHKKGTVMAEKKSPATVRVYFHDVQIRKLSDIFSLL
jgi:hypothetical protein